MQLPSLSAEIARLSNDPCPTILSCPINSSSERGRIRSASGAIVSRLFCKSNMSIIHFATSVVRTIMSANRKYTSALKL